MSNLLAYRLADELWMLAVSFLPIRNVIPHLTKVSKYFNDVIVWGPTSGALMWREMHAVPTEHNPNQNVLIYACKRGAPLTHVSMLVKCIALDSVDGDEWTAMWWASYGGHDGIMRTLLEANADPNMASNNGVTPLITASSHGHSAVVANLVAAGARVNHACRNGWTALMRASEWNYADVVRVLVAEHADLNLRNMRGLTALDIAHYFGNDEIATILESAMSH